MKILYITHTNSKDGSCIALINILKYMKDRHEVRVFAPKASASPDLSNFCRNNGIKCYDSLSYGPYVFDKNKNMLKRIRNNCRTIIYHLIARLAIKKVIDDFKPDIVHENTSVIDLAFKYCIKKGIPHVWHIREYHDSDFGIILFPSEKVWYKRIQMVGNYNIAITKGIFNYFNLRSSDTVIYDGPICESEIQKNEVIEKQKYFLFVAACISFKGKGLLDAIKAFDLFSKEHDGYVLKCAGRIENNDYYAKCMQYIADNNLKGKILFMGSQPREQIFNLMSHATALLVPSSFEGFGFTVIEAMVNSCLVIGRNTAGVKEQFDNGLGLIGEEIGLRFYNWQEMFQCMDVAVNEDTEHMRMNAFQTVTTLYTYEKNGKQLENYYKGILGSDKKYYTPPSLGLIKIKALLSTKY